MWIALTIVCLFGLVFILLTTFFLVRSVVLITRGNAVTGRVVDVLRVQDNDGGDTFLPIFEYEWEGRTYRKKAGFSSNPPRYRVGETVSLYVDAANPADAVPRRFMDLWFMPLLFGFLAGVMLVVALVVYFTT